MANTTDEGSAKEIHDVWHILVKSWLLVSLVVGVAGNALIATVILRKGKVRVASYLFNLNLTVADFFRVAVFTPVYLLFSHTRSWPIGLPGCRFMYLVLYSSFCVTVMTLMSLSWERYRGIVHPLKKQVRTFTELTLLVCF